MKHVGTAGIRPLWRNVVGDSAQDVAESPAECAQAAETNVEANVRYAPIRGTQEKHRALNPPALEIAVRGLAERRTEGADEVRLRHLRNSRELWDAEWFRKRAIHRIPRAQHPAIAFFHRSVHNATLYAVQIRNGKRLQFRRNILDLVDPSTRILLHESKKIEAGL
jgi:hypothetical protein